MRRFESCRPSQPILRFGGAHNPQSFTDSPDRCRGAGVCARGSRSMPAPEHGPFRGVDSTGGPADGQASSRLRWTPLCRRYVREHENAVAVRSGGDPHRTIEDALEIGFGEHVGGSTRGQNPSFAHQDDMVGKGGSNWPTTPGPSNSAAANAPPSACAPNSSGSRRASRSRPTKGMAAVCGVSRASSSAGGPFVICLLQSAHKSRNHAFSKVWTP